MTEFFTYGDVTTLYFPFISLLILQLYVVLVILPETSIVMASHQRFNTQTEMLNERIVPQSVSQEEKQPGSQEARKPDSQAVSQSVIPSVRRSVRRSVS